EPGDGLERRARIEQRCNGSAVAEQQKLDVGVAVERQLRAGNDHRRPMVTPHGVERNADSLGHGARIPCRRWTQQGAGNHCRLPLRFCLSVASGANGCAESSPASGKWNTASDLRGYGSIASIKNSVAIAPMSIWPPTSGSGASSSGTSTSPA